MQHCTPEQLALAALREPLPHEDDAHLAACTQCRAEVSSLRHSVDILAVPELAAPATPVAPPPAVWAAIAATTGVSASPRPEPHTQAPVEAPNIVPLAPARRRRSLRARALLIAASLLVGAGLGAGAVALAARSGQQGGEQVVAASLRPIGPDGATGSATVLRRGDAQVLEVKLRAPALASGYYEVWLAESDLKHMIAVGILHDGTGDLDLPAGIDLSSYRVVDVSAEPLDGDPAHSAVSVARGRLAK